MFSSLLPAAAALLLTNVANASPLTTRSITTIPLTRRTEELDHETEVQTVRRRFGQLLQPASSLQQRDGVFAQEGLTNYQDVLWYGDVYFGTPPQRITINFDTGSSDIVIPTDACSNCTLPHFNPSLSSTFRATDTPANITYADKSGASGVVAYDSVSIGVLTVQNQGFIAANFASVGFASPNAGLMGLGFPSISRAGDGFFTNLAKTGMLYENSFSFYLSRGGASGSELCFGCRNPTKFTGDVQYYPVNAAVFNGTYKIWNIDSAGFSIGGTIVSNPFPAAIDSGTSRIIISIELASQIFSKIQGAQYKLSLDGSTASFFLPCASINSTSIEIVFGNTPYAINPADLNGGPIIGDPSTCRTNIIGTDTGLAIIGDAFMKNWYSIFDYQNFRVGLAKAI